MKQRGVRMGHAMKHALAVLLSLNSGAPAFAAGTAGGKGGKCDYSHLVKKCKADGMQTGMQLQGNMAGVAGANKDNMVGGASGQQTALGFASQNLAKVAGGCEKAAAECDKICKNDPKMAEQCKQELMSQAGQWSEGAKGLAQNSTSAGQTADSAGAGGAGGAQPQSSGGMMSGLGQMLPMLMSAGMMAMMMGNQKENEQQNQMPQLPPPMPGALQPNGMLDCSKPDASLYQDCNSYLTQICTQSMYSGNFGADSNCQNFSRRFCTTEGMFSAPITGPNMPAPGRPGEGLSIDPGYCAQVNSFYFCSQPGRGACPSCANLAKRMTPACQSQPAACLAENSPAQMINDARQTCPTDPIFANPAITGAAGAAGAVATELNPGGPAVLPPNVGVPAGVPAGSGGVPVAGLPGGYGPPGGAAAPGAPLPSVVLPQSVKVVKGAAQDKGSAVREGQSRGVQPASLERAAVRRGSARDVAPSSTRAAGGSERSATSAHQMTGPASDVVGQYGPSLFAMSTQILRQKCQAGKLNCR